jgi:hypothetical protein
MGWLVYRAPAGKSLVRLGGWVAAHPQIKPSPRPQVSPRKAYALFLAKAASSSCTFMH